MQERGRDASSDAPGIGTVVLVETPRPRSAPARGGLYRVLFDTVAVRTDPELAHHLGMSALTVLGRTPLWRLARAILGRRPAEPVPAADGGGPFVRPVPGRVGLAAGLDKNATSVLGLDALGFGFVEIGTVTPRAQPGNEKPRLWRHPEVRALRNSMGFNNDGAAVVADRLRALRSTPRGRAVVVGVNIGKNKVTAPELAAEDYALAARALARWADYLVVNVSSPNTPGLRDLQGAAQLTEIVAATRRAAREAAGREVPVFVKIAPDLTDAQIDEIADLVAPLGLAGVVATNTTIEHDLGEGGLSGTPLRERALDVVRRLRARLGEGPVVMGVGGVTSEDDARAMLAAGATLVQVYSAFIYEGPALPGRLGRAVSRSSRRA